MRSFIVRLFMLLALFVATHAHATAPAGTIDATFDTDGIVTTDIGSSTTDEAYDVALQSDGKIVVVGISNNDFAVVRYNSDGSIDTSFGAGGKVITDIGGSTNDIALSIVIQADGKMVVAGTYANSPDQMLALVRYNVNGSLDSSFGTGGKVLTGEKITNNDFCSDPNMGACDVGLALQNDGKIVVGGSGGNIKVLRYGTNGSADTSFDADGKVELNIGWNGYHGRTADVAVQPDGKIVVSGWIWTNGAIYSDFAIARLNTDGSLDTSFDTDGLVFINGGTQFDESDGLALQPDGKMLVTGSFWNKFGLVRLAASGSLDASFDSDGIYAPETSGRGLDIAVQADGKIIVGGGREEAPFVWNLFIKRLNSDGSLDSTFDGDGEVTNSSLSKAHAVAIQSDGKIVAVGGANGDFGVVRYNGTPVSVPDAPTIGTATAGNAQATVTFTAPASNGGSAITGYTVTSNPPGGTDTNAGTTGLSHVITGLTNGTAYTFTVTATNSVGTGAASAASNSVKPTDLTITTASLPGGTTGTAYSQTLAATGGNQQCYYWWAPGLPPGLELNSSTGVISGTPTTAGTYAFTANVTDCSSPTVVSKALSITVAAAGMIDVQMTALTASTGSVAYGGNLTVSDALTVTGTMPNTLADSYVFYYLSTDSTITTADTRIGYRYVNGAMAKNNGGSTGTGIYVTIPATVAPGTYYIGAIADATNALTESSEENNTRATATTITVTVPVIDLQMTALTASAGSVVAGGSLTVGDTVTNTGSAAMTAGSSYVFYYLSTDSTITTADTRIGSRYVPGALAAGGTSTAAATYVTIPGTIAPGTYYIGAIADATGTQAETNEGNNARATASPITVTAPNIDLQMTALAASAGTMTRGSSYTVSDTVTNTGTSAMTASGSYVFYYLSTDENITAADTRIGYRYVPGALGAGNASTVTAMSITIPASVATGTYYIGAIADATGMQAETSEVNNTRATVSPINVQ